MAEAGRNTFKQKYRESFLYVGEKNTFIKKNKKINKNHAQGCRIRRSFFALQSSLPKELFKIHIKLKYWQANDANAK